MKKKCWLFLLLLISSLLFSCTATHTNKAVVDIDFATKISDWYRNGGKDGYNLALETLDSLNRQELRELKALIEKDIFNNTGIIVNPPLPVEYRIISGLRKNIDDRLGILDYNLVVEGRILGESSLPSTVYWYSFKPKCGQEFEVHIGSALVPPALPRDLTGLDVRLFIRVYRNEAPDRTISRAVMKIELLKDDPSLDTSPR